ncbi:MAG: dTMP kinase [Geminicoccaceae bacterium]|nr:dTMP kinase [Geminicoccaceae bacterium]MCX8102411.1 dTMP kinase [Geminicoccaceae bacterium]MDW8371259.1 dTMP kinase [Geminicoccaceae bacterium]
MASPAGRLLTLEGGEGAGKSTQLARLAAFLEGRGIAVERTREPGGTEGAEAIRALLLEGGAERWSPACELLLVCAARRDHLEKRIEPALAAGRWVLCDRYLDSTRVYQGIAGGLGLELVDRLQQELLGFRLPDLTILLDLPVEQGLARRHGQGGASRFERKGTSFHEKVRAGFLELARAEPDRFLLIDAARPVELVAAEIAAKVAARFGLRA